MVNRISVKFWVEKIDPINTELFFTATCGEHHLEFIPWWETCGETGSTIRCSCDFHSVEAPGKGCWQRGHNEKREHALDPLHAVLFAYGACDAVLRGHPYAYPAFAEGALEYVKGLAFDELKVALKELDVPAGILPLDMLSIFRKKLRASVG